MRYLNRIIFINSANVSYAEISVDGNVHFIGTQGVGKSTTLRAILFFYNADKLKLGIEKGKRTFDEYYFSFGNSYIVYEVFRETGPFCVLAFKSQGRAAFRFIDGPYSKDNFISPENKAMVWDQVRSTLSGVFNYSRKIERYEEYRDILYGNNKGFQAEFRKYALIESRQYQNLPRTIQNVFLNSKLEAEFIKQTIIMSLNEEDVKINLDQYALHLKDFEQQLADIGRWSDKNRAGEVVVRLLAGTISNLYTAICFLEKEKVNVAQLLIATQVSLEKSFPGLLKQLENEKEKFTAASKKVAEANQKFQEKKDKINKEIILLDARLHEAKQKFEDYSRLNIQSIIGRINKRTEWESKKDNFKKEQDLLSSRFREITSKYDALILQHQNQLNDFINSKNNEKNVIKEANYKTIEELNKQYDKIIREIEKESSEAKTNAEEVILAKTTNIHGLEIKKREVELKRWFENEIDESKKVISESSQLILAATVEIRSSKSQIESLQKQWDLDLSKYEADNINKITRINESIAGFKAKIEQINGIIEQSKNSLYDWLHENKPGWEQTIGKIINQEQVLFHSGLSPKLTETDNNILYGVEIDLKEISSNVKTIADYEQERQQLTGEIKKSETSIAALVEEKTREQEKFKKKYQPQIKVIKELSGLKEYEYQKATTNKELAIVERDEWQFKGIELQKTAITSVKQEIVLAREEKALADEQLLVFNNQIRTQISGKRKERDTKIAGYNEILQTGLNKLSTAIIEEKALIQIRIAEITNQANKTMENEGADTERINAIEKELTAITDELKFIEENRHVVSDYNKDKRELFDLVDQFKVDKKISETRLLTEQQRHDLGKARLQEAVDKLNLIIDEQETLRKEIDEDLHEFDVFRQTEVFLKLDHSSLIVNEVMKPVKRLKALIAELNDRSFSLRDRLDELRASTGKFLSHFSPSNIFGFKTNLIENQDYFQFAENLKEFLEEDKIAEYEKRTNEHFASLIIQLGKETNELVSKEAVIQKVITDINKDFEERNFAGVIKSISLRLSDSANKIVMLLSEIRSFNNEHSTTLGATNLFSIDDTELNNKKAVGHLKNFANEIATSKQHEINLSDTFELEFRVVENDNDSGWVEKLTHVGSEGTDILVKAMINIMLLNVFKESASKRFKDFRLHCMMDEIGKLHPNNVKGILKFANDRNIVLINSSPTSYNALDYKHTYLLAKDNRNATTVKKLITNILVNEIN